MLRATWAATLGQDRGLGAAIEAMVKVYDCETVYYSVTMVSIR
jgi:hypothetical protein